MFCQFSKQYTKPFWCYDYVKRAPQKLLFANFSKLKREGYNFGGRCNASEHIGTLSTYLTIGPTFYWSCIDFFFSFTTPRDIRQSFTIYGHGVNEYSKGQLISKCPFGVIVSTKIPTKKFDNFCPRNLKRGQIIR